MDGSPQIYTGWSLILAAFVAINVPTGHDTMECLSCFLLTETTTRDPQFNLNSTPIRLVYFLHFLIAQNSRCGLSLASSRGQPTMRFILTRLSNGPTVKNFCSKLENRKYLCLSSKAKSPALSSFNFGFDPYEYTSGRWLRADAAQRNGRRVKFNFPALCQKAINSAPGAREILECSKVEGNFNRAFIIQLDNGSRVVAKVPFPVAGPTRLVTNSEVATMAYCKVFNISRDRARSSGPS